MMAPCAGALGGEQKAYRDVHHSFNMCHQRKIITRIGVFFLRSRFMYAGQNGKSCDNLSRIGQLCFI